MTLSSTRGEIPRVKKFADQLNKSVQLDENRFNDLVLAVSEAVTNAVVHGNKEDQSKKVFLRGWIEGNSLHISVNDQGEGFNPDSLPDPLQDQNLLKEGGRGVFLMRQYADRISFSEGGSKVTLTFELEGS